MNSSTIRPILERLAFACYLMLLISSMVITWLGWSIGIATGDYTAMCVALGGLALSRWLHVHGHAHWHFQKCADSLEMTQTPAAVSRTEREENLAEEIARLFAQLESEDDVWARGELRREVAAKFAVAPELREEFAEALAAHPEI